MQGSSPETSAVWLSGPTTGGATRRATPEDSCSGPAIRCLPCWPDDGLDQASLREWAYARAYDTSDQRCEDLAAFLSRDNWHRPHGGIYGRTPVSRLSLTEDDLSTLRTQASWSELALRPPYRPRKSSAVSACTRMTSINSSTSTYSSAAPMLNGVGP